MIWSSQKAKEGFTVFELMIVIIIVGILSGIGFISFLGMLERGRAAEAKRILGEIRQAERAYWLNNATYTTSMDMVGQDAPTACGPNHYFFYSISAATTDNFTAVATRCSVAGAGKFPPGPTDYDITVDSDGNLSGSEGYY